MADDNKPIKYARYAVGEIVLVVIGILIALSINNWNDERKAKEKTNKLFVKVQKELLYNIVRCKLIVNFYRGKDSLIYNVRNKKLTYNDYKSNPKYYSILDSWEEAKLVDIAFNNLTENDSELSQKQDSIVLRLKNLYGTQKIGVDKWDDRTASLILDNWDKLKKEKEWFKKSWIDMSEIETEYFLTDPFYLNDVTHYSSYKLNHLNYTLEFKDEATSIYEEISDNLDLKMDSTVVKNMNDYKHYIGVYEYDSIENTHVVLEKDRIKANFISKNDTIILDSSVIVPESKEYFMIDNIVFGQLIFDENDEVIKMVISRNSYREEFKKID